MKRVIFSITILIASMINIFAQENVRSLYFLNEWSQRNTLNASFAPETGYFTLPVLGGVELSINSNVGLNTFLYPPVGNTLKYTTFMHKSVGASLFLDKLDPFSYVDQRLNLNLLSFGFHGSNSGFWNFGISLKEKMNVNLPKDLFRLMKSGMTGPTNTFDLKDLWVEQSNYAQVALGYSREINSQLRVGLTAKLLVGLSSERIKYDKFDVTLNNDQYSVSATGQSQIVSDMISFDKDGQYYDLTQPSFSTSNLKPAGYGFAADLGVTYKPIPKLTLAAGINDLGMLKWKASSIKTGAAASNFSFTGFREVNSDSISAQMDQIQEDAKKLIKFKETSTVDDLVDNIPYNINVSAEYSIFNNENHDILVGVLYRNSKYASQVRNDVVASVTLKPLSWFTLSGTAEVTNENFNRYGVGLNLSPSWINLFIAADYLVPKVNKQYIPIEKANLNIAFGGSIGLGKGKDSDNDGVSDRKDLCPDTPVGVKVDKNGCPIDSDGDGVADYLDKCPDTPAEAIGKVDANGCPLDSDRDGVADYLDQCPDSPAAAKGFVDEKGCPIDTDKDGVFDYADKCPSTPEGVTVDANGCPVDTDGDGVADYLDKCPDNPAEAKGMVDANGCPLDSDEDGVVDYLDLCNNTPAEYRAFVDKNGCPSDKDNDGVADYLDKCPDTPADARGMVDENGCPRDTDGDGIYDYLDYCPKLAGVASNHGCPELKKEIRTLFQKALQGIQFETGKDVIKKESNTILNQIAKVLIDNPTYLVEVQGHTDNVGKADMNQILSEKRANAVRYYLIAKSVDEKRITAKGYGDTRPVASNATAKGKAKNRRVEFVVTFEEVKFE
jgi:outer membrane protein OmpA-like peptidoglycan-associated protein